MVDYVQGRSPNGASAPWLNVSGTSAGDNLQTGNFGPLAVRPAQKSSDTAADLDHRKRAPLGLTVYGDTLKKISQNENLEREIDDLMNRLFKAMDGVTEDATDLVQAAHDVEERVALEFYGPLAGTMAGEPASVGVGSLRKDSKIEGDPLIASNRERLLSRIEAALNRLGKLRTKLHDYRDDAYNAYSAIMTNLRTAIAAHGRLTPDIVRLVLS
jgi:hypothetical protein